MSALAFGALARSWANATDRLPGGPADDHDGAAHERAVDVAAFEILQDAGRIRRYLGDPPTRREGDAVVEAWRGLLGAGDTDARAIGWCLMALDEESTDGGRRLVLDGLVRSLAKGLSPGVRGLARELAREVARELGGASC